MDTFSFFSPVPTLCVCSYRRDGGERAEAARESDDGGGGGGEHITWWMPEAEQPSRDQICYQNQQPANDARCSRKQHHHYQPVDKCWHEPTAFLFCFFFLNLFWLLFEWSGIIFTSRLYAAYRGAKSNSEYQKKVRESLVLLWIWIRDEKKDNFHKAAIKKRLST